jgi:hypothetical protein
MYFDFGPTSHGLIIINYILPLIGLDRVRILGVNSK